MTTTTTPSVGDAFEYAVVVSQARNSYRAGTRPGHRGTGRNRDRGTYGRECDPDGRRACPLCFDQWETRTSTVVDVVPYMDNSTDVVLADGTIRTVVPPSGDASF